ncbi:MAG: mandelate racemase/muconate lactonizing enzyme family protein, partial [Burkholderiaceae bacterium]
MKVVSAEIFGLNLCPSPRWLEGQRWRPIILKLVTDEGLVGIGEAGLAYGIAHNGAVGMVKDLVEAFVIGADPLDREAIWNRMHRHSFWGGAAGPVINAGMSAVDIALW